MDILFTQAQAETLTVKSVLGIFSSPELAQDEL